MKNLVIMIAGPSASGKSTLACEVARRLRIPCLGLDERYIRYSKAYLETPNGRVRTYERPELYDGGKLAITIANRNTPLVVEGFCLFAYPQILRQPALRFYVDVPFAICAARRAARRPQRPSDKSFALVGEQETARVVLPQRDLPDVRVLDGLRATAELAETILSYPKP